jgi:enoyl-CoA hydratase
MGLANRLVEAGNAREEAEKLAAEIAAFPQICMRHDRLSCYEQAALGVEEALNNEFARAIKTVASGETLEGAKRFIDGHGRHGHFHT